MWFLIKGTFWFSLVLVLLPFLNAESTATLEKGPTVQLGDTFSAASEAINYVTAICLEKPDVCEKGSETFVALGHRAREGAKIAYQFLDTQFAEDGTAVAKADPDGHTFIFGNNQTHGNNMFLLKEPGYDAVKDFAPVVLTLVVVSLA